ncbi:hypothetical protein CDD83_1641 [Cordyceps sp. RAO-2017]|nr:hypothetical protein CDD83_1641 [Cordyceps sp. RAO-2017]
MFSPSSRSILACASPSSLSARSLSLRSACHRASCSLCSVVSVATFLSSASPFLSASCLAALSSSSASSSVLTRVSALERSLPSRTALSVARSRLRFTS